MNNTYIVTVKKYRVFAGDGKKDKSSTTTEDFTFANQTSATNFILTVVHELGFISAKIIKVGD